jgi:2-polyprenyl-6-methoxyphenol hydroxylase-like FAD-dependent oxidoreductase
MERILVVGAGPVGLTAALELARLGHDVTIIDKNQSHSTVSKAIGINPRSLELLEPSGVTADLLAQGIHANALNMHVDGKVRTLNISAIQHKYNFMLFLPQDQTEIILEAALNRYGVCVERNTDFLSLIQQDEDVAVQLCREGETYQQSFSFVIGTDGAHSLVRKNIGANFLGADYPDDWNLADVIMLFPYAHDEANVFLRSDGHVLAAFPIGRDRFRLIANCDDAIALLPTGCEVKQIIWQSNFKLHHRIADCYRKGRVFLAGDAAHVHAPIGGRGMNLGIEDACVLAKMLTDNQWMHYHEARFAAGMKVVNETDRAYHLLTLRNKFAIFLRNKILLPLMFMPSVQRKQLTNISGIAKT